jgi:hypothetical protein
LSQLKFKTRASLKEILNQHVSDFRFSNLIQILSIGAQCAQIAGDLIAGWSVFRRQLRCENGKGGIPDRGYRLVCSEKS